MCVKSFNYQISLWIRFFSSKMHLKRTSIGEWSQNWKWVKEANLKRKPPADFLPARDSGGKLVKYADSQAPQPFQWLRICLQCRRSRFSPWVGKIAWRREWQLTPVLLPGESHGQSIGLQRVRNDWSNLACTQLMFTGPRSGENVSVTVLEKWRQLPISPQAYSGPS